MQINEEQLLHPQLLQPIPQRPKTDPQPFRRCRLVPSRRLKRFLDSLSFNRLQIPLQIDFAIWHSYSLSVTGLTFGNNLRGRGGVLDPITEVQILSVNLIGIAQGKGPLQNIFQLPNITGELIALEPIDGSRC